VATQAFETFKEWVANPRGYGWSHPFHLEWRDLAEPERSQFVGELVDFYHFHRSAKTQAGGQFDLLDVLISMNADEATDLIEPELRELRDPAWKCRYAPYRLGEIRIGSDESLSERMRIEGIVKLLERRHLLGDGQLGDAAEILSLATTIVDNERCGRSSLDLVVSALQVIGVTREDGEAAIAVASMLSGHAEHTYSGYEIWSKLLGVPNLARRHLGIAP